MRQFFAAGLLLLFGSVATGCLSLTELEQRQWRYLLSHDIVQKPKEYRDPIISCLLEGGLIGGLPELAYFKDEIKDMDFTTPGFIRLGICVGTLGYSRFFTWPWAWHNTNIYNIKRTIRDHLDEIPESLGGTGSKVRKFEGSEVRTCEPANM